MRRSVPYTGRLRLREASPLVAAHPGEGSDGNYEGKGTDSPPPVAAHPGEGSDGKYEGKGADASPEAAHPGEGSDGNYEGKGADATPVAAHPGEGSDGVYEGKGADAVDPEATHPGEGADGIYEGKGADANAAGDADAIVAKRASSTLARTRSRWSWGSRTSSPSAWCAPACEAQRRVAVPDWAEYHDVPTGFELVALCWLRT
jgi:hypothetical protein